MSRRQSAPFRVYKAGGRWVLQSRVRPNVLRVGFFATAGDAIDHAYKNWPWWP